MKPRCIAEAITSCISVAFAFVPWMLFISLYVVLGEIGKVSVTSSSSYWTMDMSCFDSTRAKDSVKHFHVKRQNGRYSFGFNEFSCLQDFTSHLANQPLLGSETGLPFTHTQTIKSLYFCLIPKPPSLLWYCFIGNLMVLRFPYPRQVEEPSIYESVCVHTAIQSGRSESDLVPSAPSVR